MAYFENNPSERVGPYPEIEPFDSGLLAVDDIHEIYYEQCGNPEGAAALFLHGGPGAGCSPASRRFFDPNFYRIVLLDQRGSGRSKPNGCMKKNTTWDLVEDIEKLRASLKIEKFHVVFGGSWGSSLSLAYAISHPQRVRSLVLRGIFLFDHDSMNWLFNGPGASEMYPDAWEKYAGHIPAGEQGNLLNAYYRRCISEDREVYLPACRRFVEWELSIAKLQWNPDVVNSLLENESFIVPFARAETHYFVHGGFFPGEDEESQPKVQQCVTRGAWTGGLPWIIRHTDKIANIPMAIVHGRQDIVCRPRAAYELHKRCPKSTLVYIHDAGHSDGEPGTSSELVKATDRMKTEASD